MKGFGAAVRIAVREARRHRWRSLLVVLLVALPVMGSVAAATTIQSTFVRDQDAVERYMGASEARVAAVGAPVAQGDFPFRDYYDGGGEWVDLSQEEAAEDSEDEQTWRASVPPTEADLRAVLGDDVRLLPVTLGDSNSYSTADVRDGDGIIDAQLRVLDLTDPLTKGLGDVVEGRAPKAAGEAAVNRHLARAGFEVGGSITTRFSEEPLKITGIIEDADLVARDVLWVHPSASDEPSNTWLVGPAAGAPKDAAVLTRDLVTQLNTAGFVVASRHVAENAEAWDGYGDDYESGFLWGMNSDEDIAVTILVITMVIIEIALLAGPAFAVTARQQARTVALMSVNGATPQQARRVVLAAALVLGGAGAVLGALLGPLVALGLRPIAQSFNGERFGGFSVPWPLVLATALIGFVSALLAAVVPAWFASRQDPVAVMNGRRSDKISSQGTRNSAVFGSLVLAAGVLLMVVSLYNSGAGAILLMTVSVVVTTLGIVLLVPAAVALVARVFGGSSFVARYTSRDAVRHRSRTVPAVAAVAATVAGVIAVGTAAATENAGYSGPSAEDDSVQISVRTSPWDEAGRQAKEKAYDDVEVAASGIEGVSVSRVRTLLAPDESIEYGSWYLFPKSAPEGSDPWSLSRDRVESYATSEPVVVDPESYTVERALTAAGAEQANAALREGSAVELVHRVTAAEQPGELRFLDESGPGSGEIVARTDLDVVQVAVDPDNRVGVVSGVLLPRAWVEQAGMSSRTDWLEAVGVDGEDGLAELRKVAGAAADRVEVGQEYASSWETLLFALILGAMGVLLMLVGTLSATLLALHDADADLGTLSAVGAAPSTRRGIARGYALLVSGVGAVLGVPIGLVVGVAAADQSYGTGDITVPWELIGLLLVVVPVFTAVVVGWSTRARMPLVRRAL